MFSFLRSLPSGASRIPASEAVAKVAAGELSLIDVREPMEIAMTGRAKGALQIPLAQVGRSCDPDAPSCAKGLSRSRPVAVYCASGARSAAAASQLRAMGYETVYNLGSLHDWAAGGGAVVR